MKYLHFYITEYFLPIGILITLIKGTHDRAIYNRKYTLFSIEFFKQTLEAAVSGVL